jgi:hypothetical protein
MSFSINVPRRLSDDLAEMIFREENEKAVNMDFNEKKWAVVGAVLVDRLGGNNSQHYGIFIRRLPWDNRGSSYPTYVIVSTIAMVRMKDTLMSG